MDFKSFVKERKANQAFIQESFRNSDMSKAIELIEKAIQNGLGNGIAFAHNIEQDRTQSSQKLHTYDFVVYGGGCDTKVVSFNVNVSEKSSTIYSIDFFNTFDIWSKPTKSLLTIYTLGQSIAKFVPMVINIIKNNNYNISSNKSEENTNESVFYVGAQKYNITENLSIDTINTAFKFTCKLNEADEDDLKSKVEAQAKEIESLKEQLKELAEIVRGGAKMVEVNCSTKRNVVTVPNIDSSIQKQMDSIGNEEVDIKIEEVNAKLTPQEKFDMMWTYIQSVIDEHKPGVIICGAPGVGKTWRTSNQLKDNGYRDGKNLMVIGGKIGGPDIYETLYKFREKGDLILFDDADNAVGPKAPDDILNLMKKALDSSPKRKVSYMTQNARLDAPKQFVYEGSIIVLTNCELKEINSAIRTRVYTQDLFFTNQEILELIKDQLPTIEKDTLTMEAKQKAFDYLSKLVENGTKTQVSFRIFNTCASLMQLGIKNPSRYPQRIVEAMISEQMKNQGDMK